MSPTDDTHVLPSDSLVDPVSPNRFGRRRRMVLAWAVVLLVLAGVVVALGSAIAGTLSRDTDPQSLEKLLVLGPQDSSISIAEPTPATMAPDFPGPDPGKAVAVFEDGQLRLENKLLSVRWAFSDEGLRLVSLTDRQVGTMKVNAGEAFVICLEDGRVLTPSSLRRSAAPEITNINLDPLARRAIDREAGKQISVQFDDQRNTIHVQWTAVLRDESSYIRQFVRIWVSREALTVKSITLLDLQLPRQANARVVGTVAGSPVVAKNWFFACEHPNANNEIVDPKTPDATDQAARHIRCRLQCSRELSMASLMQQSAVIGVAPKGQLRRAFLYYIERERPRPYKPFLHYNSWYDIAWADRKMNQKQCLAVIEAFGRELTEKRGVALDSFVFDDGWDDNQTLWRFHKGFPDGFTPLDKAAKKYRSHVGVWLSPWGGYGRAKAERMKYGKTQGFETNQNGFSLAGPKYYGRFRDVCAEMIQKYDVNYFKFDGVGIGNNRTGAGGQYLADIEGLRRLCEDLRRLRPDVYLSITTGTWPSPYWLFWGDSTWRNGADCGFHGAGSMRQQWITYRDMYTYRMVVRRAPLYPINSLMVQGICYAQLGTATRMKNDLKDIVDEIRMLFASGTQLQELYVTPGMMTPPMWDALAEASRWSRKNADVLVDVHWIAGDPGNGEPYGYASWSPRKGILALRNPSETPARIMVDLKTAFELPDGAARRYTFSSPWEESRGHPKLNLEAGTPHIFQLAPFEAVVLEGLPIRDAAKQAVDETHQRAVTALRELGAEVREGEDKGKSYCFVILEKGWKGRDQGLSHLTALQHFTFMSIKDASVTDACLRYVAEAPSLESVSIYNCPISDVGIAQLAKLPALELLILNDLPMTDRGLASLKTESQLTTLCLDGTRITDAGLRHLRSLTKLKALRLSRTKVSDRGLKDLKTLAALRVLALWDTDVTEKGVEDFKTALPDCQILWEEE